MPFPQALARARWILGGWQRSGRLWCYGRSCWWCSQPVIKRSSPAGSGQGRRGPVKEGYTVVALLLKPSLGLFWLVGRHQVLLPHPGSLTGHLIAPGDHHTLQYIQVHFGVDFQDNFEDMRWHDVALTWNHTKDYNRSHPKGHPMRWAVPSSIKPSGFAFWGCWQWFCWHNFGSVESMNCTAVHLRSRSLNIESLSDMIEGCYRSWDLYTTGQLVDGLQQKKKTVFSLNRNEIMSSFLGRQFYHSTLYFVVLRAKQIPLNHWWFKLNQVILYQNQSFLAIIWFQLTFPFITWF